jgi:cation:H+ antiporter
LVTGLSTGVLGLTLTAIATSLPELLTTIFSQEQHDEKMTIGNILGSNIYNLLLIGGLIDVFSSGTDSSEVNWYILNLVTIIFVAIIFIYRGKQIPKLIGVVSLLLFFAYIFLETKRLY